MTAKHFVTDHAALVDGSCNAVVAQNPALKYDSTYKGCGSGHEPAHAGYVGNGMLDAAVAGSIFASPNVRQIIRGLQHIASPAGSLVIVKNYTGDKLNFGLACEQYRAMTGQAIETVLVGDDVSIPRSSGLKVGRRGLAGTVLVEKIAGAAAAENRSLEEVSKIARHVANNVGTIGSSLDFCSVPGQAPQQLPAEEVELGMGIHNEPGAQRLSPVPDIEKLVDTMLGYILNQSDAERAFLSFNKDAKDKKVVLLVNNLGGLSVIELQTVVHVTLTQLKKTHGIIPVRIYSGTFLSSLDGPGFSLTLLNIEDKPDSPKSQDLVQLLDAPAATLGWTTTVAQEAPSTTEEAIVDDVVLDLSKVHPIPCDGKVLAEVIKKIHEDVAATEPEITRLDTLMGDGDCGTTLLAGAQAVLASISQDSVSDLSLTLVKASSAIQEAMGGTSGVLYGIFFSAFATAIQELHRDGQVLSLDLLAQGAARALETLERYTAARVGSRTLMDALIPYVQQLSEPTKGATTAEVLEAAQKAAAAGSEATKTMQSNFGRSAYVGAGEKGNDPTYGLPDPGACGVVAIVGAIAKVFSEQGGFQGATRLH
ncbi:hypothetical protein DV735_g4834, partial [Chaetothyriales sp. CBS 134920]